MMLKNYVVCSAPRNSICRCVEGAQFPGKHEEDEKVVFCHCDTVKAVAALQKGQKATRELVKNSQCLHHD